MNNFSEKILKPIMNLHPFIVFSVPGFLGQLEQLGFKEISITNLFNGIISIHQGF